MLSNALLLLAIKLGYAHPDNYMHMRFMDVHKTQKEQRMRIYIFMVLIVILDFRGLYVRVFKPLIRHIL